MLVLYLLVALDYILGEIIKSEGVSCEENFRWEVTKSDSDTAKTIQ